jgi:FAD:protein FMN transferase
MTQNTKLGLGTIIRITVDHPDPREAARSSELALAAIDRIEGLMSVHRPDSEIAILNKKGFCHNVSPDTREVIDKAVHYWRITGGAFDVTVLPVLKERESLSRLGKIGGSGDAEPSPVALGLVNSKDIIIEGKNVRFGKQGIGISLGGIAKGYAVDMAVRILSENGIKSALVDAGGDIRVIGNRPGGTPWRIGLGDPKSVRKVTSVIELTDLAVATSGTYRRSIADIIDARNGLTAAAVVRATVVAKQAVDADALATSVYILGPDGGVELIDSIDGVGALILTKDGEAVESRRWKTLTGLSNAEAVASHKGSWVRKGILSEGSGCLPMTVRMERTTKESGIGHGFLA